MDRKIHGYTKSLKIFRLFYIEILEKFGYFSAFLGPSKIECFVVWVTAFCANKIIPLNYMVR